ncbi:hypothetical protein JL720_6335 [Aureococcus anophagefferens]|nr:hypothetical protein JL720_6335 [Aureococcus anophagefferens]
MMNTAIDAVVQFGAAVYCTDARGAGAFGLLTRRWHGGSAEAQVLVLSALRIACGLVAAVAQGRSRKAWRASSRRVAAARGGGGGVAAGASAAAAPPRPARAARARAANSAPARPPVDAKPWAAALADAPPLLELATEFPGAPAARTALAAARVDLGGCRDDDLLLAAWARVLAHYARCDEVVLGVYALGARREPAEETKEADDAPPGDDAWAPVAVRCDGAASFDDLARAVADARRAAARLGAPPAPADLAAALGRAPTRRRRAVAAALADGARNAARTPLLGAEERRGVLALGDAPSPPWDAATTVYGSMVAAAARYPDDAALVAPGFFEDEGLAGADAAVTYAALLRGAVAPGAALGGVGAGDAVAVVLRRCVELPIAVYGVLSTGAYYVPVDPDYPESRRASMFDDAKPESVVSETALRAVAAPAGYGGRVVFVDELDLLASAAAAAPPGPAPSDPVYVLFTSGTTGRPKGVVVPHLTLARRVAWFERRYGAGLRGGDRADGGARDGDDRRGAESRRRLGAARGVVLMKTPAFFGVSEWELFWPLTVGSTLAVLKADGERDPDYLARSAAACGCTAAFFSPAQLGVLLELLAATPVTEGFAGDAANRAANAHLGALRLAFTCGEALPARVANACVAELPRALLVNIYGPTEADITFWEAPAARGAGAVAEPVACVPIGRPVDHVRVVVLNYDGSDVAPAGVPGELAFVGDVKLRGFRVELGEVDVALGAVPGVLGAATLLHGKGTDAKLVAYARPGDLDVPSVLKALRAKLPHYMVPSAIAALRQLFADALSVDVAKVGFDGDFEALGGNSLLAGRATNAIRRTLAGAAKIKGTAMYSHASVAKLAPVVAKLQIAAGFQPGDLASKTLLRRQSTVTQTDASRAHSPTSFWPLAAQAAGATGILALRYLDWPAWYGLWYLYLSLPKPVVFCCVPALLFATDALAFALAWLAQRATLGSPAACRAAVAAKPSGVPLYSKADLDWWFAHQVQSIVTERLERSFHGTHLMTWYYRALGATIDGGALIDGRLLDPPLAHVGAYATVATGAELDAHFIRDGALCRRPCGVGAGGVAGVHAYVAPGRSVPPRAKAGPLSTTAAVGATDLATGLDPPSAAFRERRDAQLFWRSLLGVPLLYCLQALPYVPFVYVLEHACEVLCARYRLLGAKIGRRVHIDFFRCVEYDLVTVEDDVVFGSLVRIVPRDETLEDTDGGAARRVVVRREGNVLDHCVLLPGAVVGERAVLGTFSLAAAEQLFAPGAVATGNAAGRAVVLRKRPDADASAKVAATPLQKLEVEARRRHHSLPWFLGWNAANSLFALLVYPLRDVFETGIIATGYMLYWYDSWTGYYAYFACLPMLNLVSVFLHFLLVFLLKRFVLIGKYAVGDYGFYSPYHFAWALMMTLLAPIYPLLHAFHGTVFAAYFYRLMGADVDDTSTLLGKALEFDLLTVGPGASVGRLCDATCHTVENMVIKLAPVRIGARADVRSRAVVMPGGTLSDGATLLQNSLTLKGELAPPKTVWAGLPAEAVDADVLLVENDAPDADAAAPLLQPPAAAAAAFL